MAPLLRRWCTDVSMTSASRSSALDALLAAERSVTFDDKFDQLRTRVQQFSGIQPGDIVLQVNGTPVTSPEQLRALASKAGRPIGRMTVIG